MTSGAPRPFRVIFRADARPDLGGGHIMRCLTLANELRDRECEIAFACAPGSTELVPALDAAQFQVLDARSPGDLPLPDHWHGRADAIFVDLYDAGPEDEARFKRRCDVLASYGELLHQQHTCDILIDQNMGRHGVLHEDRVSSDARLLLGPAFFAARPEFTDLRAASLAARESPALNRILITMGLTDLDAISLRLAEIVLATTDAEIEVILGPHAPSLSRLQSLAAQQTRLTVTIGANDMASRMAGADLAIGAGGGTAFERCILGLPSLVCVLADNQAALADALHEAGAAIRVDVTAQLETQIRTALDTLSPSKLSEMAESAAKVCDGRGRERVADTVLEGLDSRRLGLRPALASDAQQVLEWRNRDHVRSNMYDDQPIDSSHHETWFADTLNDEHRQIMIASQGERPVGVVLYYDLDTDNGSGRWAFYVGETDVLGRGIGSAIEIAAIAYAFDKLGITRLQCEVLAKNEGVLRLHRRFGFREVPFPAEISTSPQNQARSICLQLDRSDWV